VAVVVVGKVEALPPHLLPLARREDEEGGHSSRSSSHLFHHLYHDHHHDHHKEGKVEEALPSCEEEVGGHRGRKVVVDLRMIQRGLERRRSSSGGVSSHHHPDEGVSYRLGRVVVVMEVNAGALVAVGRNKSTRGVNEKRTARKRRRRGSLNDSSW